MLLRKRSCDSHLFVPGCCWPLHRPLLHYFPDVFSFCYKLWDVKLVFSFLRERLRTTGAPHTLFGRLWSSAKGWQWNWWTSSHSFMIGQVPVCRLNSCLTQSTSKWSVRGVSVAAVPTYADWALTSPAARCSCPPAFVLVSLRRCLCMNAVFIPQRLLLHFTANGTTLCTDSGCVLLAEYPVCAPLCTSPSGADRTWQTRLAVLPARRRIWDVSDCLDGLAHRVATFLPMLLLPFHFVWLTQALQRLPPDTVRNCMHPQSRARTTASARTIKSFS